MALTETYQAVYGDLAEDQMTKVGEFATSFMAARMLGDEDRMQTLVKEAMTKMAEDEGAIDGLISTLEYAEKFGSNDEKIAVAELLPYIRNSIKEIDAEAVMGKVASWQQTAGLALSAGGLALGAAPFIGHMRRRGQRNERIKKSIKEVMQEHPELRNNPHSARYFQAIVDFAPDVAANPLMAGNVMRTMHQIGPSSVTPKMISELLQVQRGHEERSTPDQAAGEFGKHISQAAKAFGSKK